MGNLRVRVYDAQLLASRDEDNGYYEEIPFAMLDVDVYIQRRVSVSLFGHWVSTASIDWQKSLNL